ncbi:MAG: hypothetical protein U5L01_01450 [Rheinheimera sp.]|nr:hypothetical protein [Rheinheimera sp.]
MSVTNCTAAKALYPEFQKAFSELEIKMEQVTDLLQQAETAAVAENQSKIEFANSLVVIVVIVLACCL